MKQKQLCMIKRYTCDHVSYISARSLLKDHGEAKGFESRASFKNWKGIQFAENEYKTNIIGLAL